MTDRVLIQMSSPHRFNLIEKHRFYVAQAKTRLMSQFQEHDIRAEADSEGEKFLADHQSSFNQDLHDGSEFFEMAGDARNERYQLLTKMRDITRLSIISAFFHEWEKSLRQWLADEVLRYPCQTGLEARDAIWTANLCKRKGGLFNLLESFGWPLKSAPYFADLDACRLVVNVYKHGDGPSLSELAKSYPRFLKHPLGELFGWLDEKWSHENLQISDQDLNSFSLAIEKFWGDVPENVFDSQITNLPSWLIKAIKKDNSQKEQAK